MDLFCRGEGGQRYPPTWAQVYSAVLDTHWQGLTPFIEVLDSGKFEILSFLGRAFILRRVPL